MENDMRSKSIIFIIEKKTSLYGSTLSYYTYIIFNKLYSMRENLNFRRLLSTNGKNSQYSDEFCQWLVGFTDGDGSFSIVKSGGSYRLHFGLSQSFYNIRILYYINEFYPYLLNSNFLIRL